MKPIPHLKLAEPEAEIPPVKIGTDYEAIKRRDWRGLWERPAAPVDIPYRPSWKVWRA